MSLTQFCRRGTDVPAVFSFAAIFVDSDDYETGNLVMGDNPAPEGLNPGNMFVSQPSPETETHPSPAVYDMRVS